MVRIFPKVANQVKNTTRGNLIPPNTPPKEKVTIMGGKGTINCSNIKEPSLGRGPRQLAFPTPS